MKRAALLGLAAGLLLGTGTGLGLAASLNVTSQNFTPYQTCTLTATPASTPVVADATVDQTVLGTNFGTDTLLRVESSQGSNVRTYITFDLTSCVPRIPATAIVRLATTRLFATLLPNGCRTFDLFSVAAAWTEVGITWNNQPFGVTVNNPPSASRSTSFNIGTAGGCQNSTLNAYVTATVTANVQSMVSGALTNRGWMLRDDAEEDQDGAFSAFTSKDAGTVSRAPQLIVTYVAVP